MSKHLEPISKLNAREPKVSGAGMPDRNKETYSKMPGMGCHGTIPSGTNVKAEINAGKPVKQAVAIAYATKRAAAHKTPSKGKK